MVHNFYLQLHAISECFKKPFPAVEENDKRYDLTHVLDLCSQLSHLTVNGSSDPYLNSNIIPNNLKFEFSCFKVYTIFTMIIIILIKTVLTAAEIIRSQWYYNEQHYMCHKPKEYSYPN